jgi:hypothetical protein
VLRTTRKKSHDLVPVPVRSERPGEPTAFSYLHYKYAHFARPSASVLLNIMFLSPNNSIILSTKCFSDSPYNDSVCFPPKKFLQPLHFDIIFFTTKSCVLCYLLLIILPFVAVYPRICLSTFRYHPQGSINSYSPRILQSRFQ